MKTAGAVLLLAALVWATLFVRDQRRARLQLRALSDELHVRRLAADSCQGSLAAEEAEFQEYHRQVDSLREEVREFEELDPRGVPGEQYDAYLQMFESYDNAVTAWEERADQLAAHGESCRALVREHNVIADSLQRALRARDGSDPEEER